MLKVYNFIPKEAKKILEKLRAELDKYIDLYGNLHHLTIAKSQELDVEIVRFMREGN